jgi:RecA/RadA recombinase
LVIRDNYRSNALKFYASVRIDVRKVGQLKEGDEMTGNRTRAKIVKNKVALLSKKLNLIWFMWRNLQNRRDC